MGCLCSVSVPVPDERVAKVIDDLDLKPKHLKRLWKLFCSFDDDKSGTIDTAEFYKMIDEEPSLFGDSIFELIDVSNNGLLEFGEFVQALATFCMFGTDDILKFCFYIFDKDRNGFINSDELQDLVGLLHSYATSNVESVMNDISSMADQRVTFKQFKALNHQYPFILYPAFRIHLTLQRVTLGMKFWDDLKRQKKQDRDEEKLEKTKQRREANARRIAQIYEMKREVLLKKMGVLKFFACYYCITVDKLPLVELDPKMLPPTYEELEEREMAKKAKRHRRAERKNKKISTTSSPKRNNNKSSPKTVRDVERGAQRRRQRNERAQREKGRERRSKKNKNPVSTTPVSSSSTSSSSSKKKSKNKKSSSRNRRRKRKQNEGDLKVIDL